MNTGNTPLTTYAKALKADREDANLNQDELARRIGSKQQTVSGWEAGKSVPGPHYQAQLVEVFGKHCRVSAIPKRGEFRLLLEAKNGYVEEDSDGEDAKRPSRPTERLGDKLGDLFELLPDDPMVRAIAFGKCAELLNSMSAPMLLLAPSRPSENKP
jgi:transcriptional regulator with XRE-family HTH domain